MHADSSVPGSPLREGFDLERPESLLVVPKGGTLERLVNILVPGVEDFSRKMARVGAGDPKKLFTFQRYLGLIFCCMQPQLLGVNYRPPPTP
jgi:hypothetical protein